MFGGFFCLGVEVDLADFRFERKGLLIHDNGTHSLPSAGIAARERWGWGLGPLSGAACFRRSREKNGVRRRAAGGSGGLPPPGVGDAVPWCLPLRSVLGFLGVPGPGRTGPYG